MATTLSATSVTLYRHSDHRPFEVPRSSRNLNFMKIQGTGRGDNSTSTDSSTSGQGSDSDNLLLKTAWYGSELLGIAASFFRSPENLVEEASAVIELAGDGIDRSIIVETIKGDFQRSYFVTGALTLDAYEGDCEFADPAGSFKGVGRFKRNCTNFGSLIEKSNMKLTKWEDFEDKGIGPVAPCHSHGNLFFQLQVTRRAKNREKYVGMWSTGMCQRWHYSNNS